MTMILGFNLGDVTYISGDTRVTDAHNNFEDNVQKIEIIKAEGTIFVAAAGCAIVASEFVSAIKSGKISIPINRDQLISETEYIIELYLKKIFSLNTQPIEPLKPIILLFQYFVNDRIHMVAYYFTFIENNSRITRVREFVVKPNEYIKIGAIGEKTPVFVDVIPSSSLMTLRKPLSGSIPFEVYLEVTDEIFEIAKARGEISIGGKTTTLMTYRVDKNKYTYRGIRGYKSVIHSDNLFQDVSMYTDLDIVSGRFYLRDMRKDGRIVSDLECINGEYRFLYDSCPPDFGENDIYYKIFSTFSIEANLNLEFMDIEL